MQEFKCGPKIFSFQMVTGHVLSDRKFSETRVWSSGGGGYISTFGGFVEANEVHSKPVTCHEFWLITAAGAEEYVQITGADIPLREGQKISIIYLREKRASESYHALLINHNAKKFWFTKGLPNEFFFFLNLEKLLMHGIIYYVISASLTYALIGIDGFGISIFISLFLIFIKVIKNRQLTKRMFNHLVSLPEEILPGVTPA